MKTLLTILVILFSCSGSSQEMRVEPNDEKEAKAFFGRHSDLSAPLTVYDVSWADSLKEPQFLLVIMDGDTVFNDSLYTQREVDEFLMSTTQPSSALHILSNDDNIKESKVNRRITYRELEYDNNKYMFVYEVSDTESTQKDTIFSKTPLLRPYAGKELIALKADTVDEVLRITSSRKIGLWTTSPNYPIDIFWHGERVSFLNKDSVWTIIDSVATLKALNEVSETLKEIK